MVVALKPSRPAPQPQAERSERVPHLAALTGLRFFAALWVLVYHISISSSLPLPAVAGIGYAGVGFFFVLSGFILAYTYLDAHGRFRGSRMDFWRARAARIYPLYAVAYLVAAGPALWSHLSAETLGVAAPAALLLVQAWLPWAADAWNGPGWSLSAEAFFYALFPFVAVPVARLGRRGLVRLTALCWALALAAPVTYIALNPDHLRSWGWGDGVWMRVLRFDPLVRLPEFLLGVALGCLFVQAYRGVEATGRSRARLWNWLAVAALAAVVALPTLHVPLPYVLLHNGLLDPFFAVAIYSLAWRAGWLARVLGSAPLVRLGQASYALYILHVPVLLWLTHLAPAPQGAGIDAICYWAGAAGLCIVLALLAHRYVEEPARRRLRPNRGVRVDTHQQPIPLQSLSHELDGLHGVVQHARPVDGAGEDLTVSALCRHAGSEKGAIRPRLTIVAWFLALVALTSVGAAMATGFWHTAPGSSYPGFAMLSEDGSQYLAAIRQGSQGFLLYHDQFTTQPAPPIVMYPLYMLAGWLLAPLRLAPPIVFDLLHIAAAAALVAALWMFAYTFCPRRPSMAYALSLFGGSLAIFPIVLSKSQVLLPYLTSELGTIQELLFSVHECAGLAAQAIAFVAYRRLRGWRRAVALLLGLSILGCSYPFNLPIVVGALVLDTLWAVWDARRIDRDAVLLVGLIAPVMSVIPAYYWLAFHAMPYWRTSTFLHLDMPQPSALLWTFGALALLALPQVRSRSARLLWLWLLVAIVFMLSRVAQPPRVLAGLWLPLAVMAAETLGRLRRPSLRLATVCTLSTSGLLMPFFLTTVVAANSGRFPIFQPSAVDEVGRYLSAHATARDVVMADYEVSNILVGEAPIRVVAGQGFQTLDLATAVPLQRRYPRASAAERHAIERRYGITYVVVDRVDRALVARMAEDRAYRRVYQDSGYCVYLRVGGKRAPVDRGTATR